MSDDVPDIVEWAEGPHGFYVDRHWAGDRWQSRKAPIILAPHHRAILAHCFTPDDNGRMPYDTVAICESAKSGKSMLGGLIAEYFALHVEAPSEVYLVANKQDQAAGKMFKSLTDSIDYNPYLPNVDPTRYNVRFRNGSEIKAIPSNAKTEAGGRYSLVIFDEPWGIMSELEEALVSEFKVDPTRNVSVRCFIGYGGYEDSLIWRELLEAGKEQGEPVLTHITNSDGSPACYRLGRLFVYWSDHPRQPWQNTAWLESFKRIERLTHSQEERMVYCRFVGIAQPFVPPELWYACEDPSLKPLEPTKDIPLYVGVDVAVASAGDDAAVIACYKDEYDRVAIAWHKVWKGSDRASEMRIDKTVEPYIIAQSKRYNIVNIAYDPRFFTGASHRLRDKSLPAVKVVQSLPVLGPLGQGLFNLIQDQRLAYYPDEDLKNAALGVMAREVKDGLHLKKSSSRKIDLMVALQFAAGKCAPERSGKLEMSVNPFYGAAETLGGWWTEDPGHMVFGGSGKRDPARLW